MVTFVERIDEHRRYLQISDSKSTHCTELEVYTPLFRGHAASWPSINRTDYWSGGWTERRTFGKSEDIDRYILLPEGHCLNREVVPSQVLRNRITSNEVSWSKDLIFDGEFKYTPCYWEWAEDILRRSEKTLMDVDIYDAVYASLYTYDCISDVIRVFCEYWSPATNTLFTIPGETSISLWDLHQLGGLPILGYLFDEVVPSASELTNGGHGKKSRLPSTCRYLLHAYHIVPRQSPHEVSIQDWIYFWCKISLKYQPPPPRKEQKIRRPNFTYNPTGILPELRSWTNKDKKNFTDLGVRDDLMEETYLAAFISCWICLFALPKEPAGCIRPEVFKMACFMAKGYKVSLAIPVLSSLYRGLSLIAVSQNPGDAKACFPIHYVYSWIASYYNTHYIIPSSLKGPLMVKYSGEGSARYYANTAVYKRFQANHVNWSCHKFELQRARRFVDDGDNTSRDLSYFLSLRTSFLPRRVDDAFGIEPYNPHRFARQFGFCQDVPRVALQSHRRAPLDVGLRLFRHCVLTKTGQVAIFPLHEIKYRSTKSYDTWVRSAYAKDAQPRSVPSSRPIECEIIEPQLQRPSHGKGKELRHFTDKTVLSLSSHDCSRTPEEHPQSSHVGKRKLTLDEDEADSAGDQNFKHRRTRVTASPPILPSEIDVFLEPTAETLHDNKGLRSGDLGILGSLIGEPEREGHRGETEQSSIFEGVQFVSKVAQTIITSIWKALCEKLSGKPAKEILAMREQVNDVVREMRYISKSELPMLEDILDSFFQAAQSLHDAQMQFSHHQTLSSSVTRLALVNTQIEYRSKHVEMVTRDICQRDKKEAELKRELEELVKGKQDLRVLLHQAKEGLKSMQAEVPILEETIAILKVAPVTNVDKEQLRKMTEDMDARKHELRDLSLAF